MKTQFKQIAIAGILCSSFILAGCVNRTTVNDTADLTGANQTGATVDEGAVATGTTTWTTTGVPTQGTWSDKNDQGTGQAQGSGALERMVTYTLADVQARNTENSCRTIIRDKVYDVSAWIDKHPGGDRNILRLCGIDGTALFEGKHGGQERPENVLEGFQIGLYIKE